MDRRTLLASLAMLSFAPAAAAQDPRAVAALQRRAIELMTTITQSPRMEERVEAMFDAVDVVLEMHDLQMRAGAPNPQPTQMSAAFLMSIGPATDLLWMYSHEQHVAWAQRLRSQALAVNERAAEAARRHPALANNRAWMASVRGSTAAALVHSAATLGDRAHLVEALPDLDPRGGAADEQFQKGRALAIGELLMGRPQGALPAAETARALAAQAGGDTFTGERDCSGLAALAAARLSRWRDAWIHLLRARDRRANPNDLTQVELGLWRQFDGAIALVTTKAGTQIWFVRDAFERTQVIELPNLRRLDLQRFMGNDAHLGEGALGRTDQGWLLASAIGDDPRATAAFRRRLDTIVTPQGLTDAFEEAASNLTARGVRKIAWMPTPSLLQFPMTAQLWSNGQRVHDAAPMATIANPLDLARDAAEDEIGRADALEIDGGDDSIPLARIERRFVSALPRRSVGGRVLHIAAHAGLQPGDRNIRIQTGARRWITVAELMRTGAWRPPPRLVILSACRSTFDLETINEADNAGVAPGQELVSGGARAAIGSAWEVNDLASFLLATRIETNLVLSRQSPLDGFADAIAWLRTSNAEALSTHVEQLATNSLLDVDSADDVLGRIAEQTEAIPFAHPIHWAGWTYWGV